MGEALEAVERWKRAFEAANGQPAPRVTYWGRGWYLVEGRSAKRQQRHFIEWAERLERRHAPLERDE